jgi:hypothetical protein
MKWFARKFLLTILTFLSLAVVADAGTLSGTVINRTTGKPEANVALDLLRPTAGMAEVASVKSDAQGRFSVTKDAIGTAPILIRATFHDVSFNTFAPPGRPEVEVEVFEISKDPKRISVASHVIIFEPQDGKLVGAEEYAVQNSSQPPVAFFRTEGNFDFAIPDDGTLGQVSTTTSSGMAVPQASIDKGKGLFAIAYPFRPGQTEVRLSYGLPYTNNSATVKLPATYAGAKILVVVPPGVTVTGDGLTAAGQEQGMMVFTHEPLPAKGTFTVNLSGVASAQGASDDQGQGGGQEGNSRQGGPEVIAAPSRLDDFKWYIFGGLAALFAMSGILLSRKQVVVAGGVAGDGTEAAPVKSVLPAVKAKKAGAVSAATAASPAKIAAEVESQVAVTMESLKEQIFRLELRRQAGTISEEDYEREKARVNKTLRDMVQG